MNDEELRRRILLEYEASFGSYNDFASAMTNLIAVMLKNSNICPQSLVARVKTRQSLAEKVGREGKTYTALTDVTDICGIRIVLYFSDDVDRVCRLLDKEFSVDQRSVDKRTAMDPDRFGYLSVHKIVSFSAERAKLLEYAAFSRMVAEIQVRSVLQHAWAEMEHDLGYKGSTALPREQKRRFSRLAGMLELADDEFCRLRDELAQYRQQVTNELNRGAKDVELNAESLAAFLSSQKYQDLAIDPDALNMKRTVNTGIVAGRLTHLGIMTIGEVEEGLRSYRDDILKLNQGYRDEGHVVSKLKGSDLTSLSYVICARTRGTVAAMRKMMTSTGKVAPNWPEDVFHVCEQAGIVAKGAASENSD